MRALIVLLAMPTVAYAIDPAEFHPTTKKAATALPESAFVIFPQKADDGYTGVPAPPGQEWVKVGNEPWKLRKVQVAVPRGTFQGDRSHQCGKCGTSQYVVESFNRDGTHNHRCPSCGNSWRH